MAIGLVLAFVCGAVAAPSSKPFEIVAGSFSVVPSTLQAGAHEDLTTAFDFAHDAAGKTFNDVRNTVVELPPGMVGSNTAVPVCTQSQLLENGPRGPEQSACPIASQVGVISFELEFKTGPLEVSVPLYNMQPAGAGVADEFGFKTLFLTQILSVTVRPNDSGVTVASANLESIVEPHNVSVTVWGVPAARQHDRERDRTCTGTGASLECQGGDEPARIPLKPFLSNPTSCSEAPLTATLSANSWEAPESWVTQSSSIAPMTGCERVPFTPSLVVEPTTSSAESSSGLNVSLVVPQEWDSPNTFSTSNVKNVRVVLPVGYTINPSAGSGLVGCTRSEYEAETYSSLPGEGCPQEAKVGTVDVETPVLVGGEKLSGAIYIAEPFENPFGSLLALYVIVKDAKLGILVKVAGHIEPDPVTGQIVTRFDDNPQVPFSRFTLKLRQGATSPLVSPPVCGSYTAAGQVTPWSAPLTPFPVNSSFPIERGIGGGPCPTDGVPPFNPTVISGTQDNDAGGYSPFYLRLLRNDGEQEITKFTTILPPGITANLTGIPFCSDAAIEVARHATGRQEIVEPSCPIASEIGHTLVGAGVGNVLAWTPGKVYLAGPYHGSALSIVSITSATVGPFDLGTVVIRFALRINPITAQAEIDSTGSDPIPHIIDGIVVHVRDIHVYIDRLKFMRNPTNCTPLSILNTITGTGADPSNPQDQAPVTVSTHFQAADCGNLTFKPRFKASTSAKTSRALGASLHVKLTYPRAPEGTQADIRSVKVELPKRLPSRLATLQQACPDTVFNTNPASCPAASRVGTAKAITPILPVPLEGPAYFVSHGGAKFPELIIILQGYGITIDLHGQTFINEKTGITSSTFHNLPDEPVTSFELTLPQGRYSALAANGSLCASRRITVRHRVRRLINGHLQHVTRKIKIHKPSILEMPTIFTAQNGTIIRRNTPITVTGCNEHRTGKPTARR